MSKKIETDRIILRNFKEEDLQDLYEYCREEGVGEAAGWSHHKSLQETEKILKEFIKNEYEYAIVYKENNKVIGHIGVHEDSEDGREDTKELGYVLNKNYWNRGIMTEVVQAILEYLFSKDICFVYACCFQDNKASKNVIEKCGFEFENKGTFYAKDLNKTFDTFEYVYKKENWKKSI